MCKFIRGKEQVEELWVLGVLGVFDGATAERQQLYTAAADLLFTAAVAIACTAGSRTAVVVSNFGSLQLS